MAIEKIGQMTYVDEEGNEYLLFPKTKAECVEGLTPEAVGAAPAGYGLGEYTREAHSLAEVKASGFYQLVGDFLPTNSGWWGHANIVSSNYGDLTCVSIDGCKIHFTLTGGVWQPWEWVNPPMVPGVEYRTTERSNGEPVYTMKFNTGELANGGTFVYRGGSVDVVRHAASCGGAALPFHGADSWGAAWSVLCDVSSTTVTAYMGASRPTSALDVQVWYTID